MCPGTSLIRISNLRLKPNLHVLRRLFNPKINLNHSLCPFNNFNRYCIPSPYLIHYQFRKRSLTSSLPS
jgi:hypothetical protein